MRRYYHLKRKPTEEESNTTLISFVLGIWLCSVYTRNTHNIVQFSMDNITCQADEL